MYFEFTAHHLIVEPIPVNAGRLVLDLSDGRTVRASMDLSSPIVYSQRFIRNALEAWIEKRQSVQRPSQFRVQ